MARFNQCPINESTVVVRGAESTECLGKTEPYFRVKLAFWWLHLRLDSKLEVTTSGRELEPHPVASTGYSNMPIRACNGSYVNPRTVECRVLSHPPLLTLHKDQLT